MNKSDIMLLRQELREMARREEMRSIEMEELKNTLAMERIRFAHEIDSLKAELAERDRRLAVYENENMPSSTISMYNTERDNFRKRREEKIETEDGAETKKKDTVRGPPKGHIGVSHNNKADNKITIYVNKCCKCGCQILKPVDPIVKMVYDFQDASSMKIESTSYKMEKKICSKCGTITRAPDPTLCGTSFGSKILGFVLEYFNKRSTDQTISYYFNALYNFGFSNNVVWNARVALKRLLETTYKEIMDRLADAPYIQMDESYIKINGKRGYAWLVTIKNATYVVVAHTRAAAVLELHFAGLLNIPVVVDGYAGYNVFPIKQRCWVHLLREAEKNAVKNGGNDLLQYERLLKLYRSIKDRDTADAAERRDLKKHLLDIATSYEESSPFRDTLTNAAPDMFTFLRYPGMPPHNNDAERDIRDTVVLQRNVRHKLSVVEGMQVFSVLISVARTCHKQGILPRIAVESLIKDPDWKLFKPPLREEMPEIAIAV